MENTVLVHHGIKGQKWGVRRFQNADGSLTRLGEKHRSLGQTIHDHRVASKRKKALAKARAAKAAKQEQAKKEAEERQKFEEGKQKALKSGTAGEILKYKDSLTPQERNEVYNRLQWEQNIKNINEKETAVGKSRTEKMFDAVAKGTDYAGKAIKAYNTVANLYNAFSTNKIPLPKIDTDISKDNRQERNKAIDALRKRQKQESEKEQKQQERAEKKAKEQSTKDKKTKDKKDKETVKTEKFEGGDVVGEGTSRYREKEGKTVNGRWREYEETTISSLPAVYTSSGRDYASGYMEYPIYYLEDGSR